MRVLSPLLCVVLVTTLLMSIVAALVFGAATGSETLMHWKRATNSDLTSVRNHERMNKIRLVMPLRNEHLLDLPERKGMPHSNQELQELADKHFPAVAGCLPEDYAKINEDLKNDEISLRLALWRRIIAPSCDTVKRAEESLRVNKIDKVCTRQFDSYFCSSLTVEQVKGIFGFADNEIDRVEEVRSGELRVSALTDAHKIPDGFAFVNNLRVALNPEMHGRRHGRMQGDEADQQDQQAAFNPNFIPNSAVNHNNAPVIAYYPINTPFALDAASQPSTASISEVVFNIFCENAANPAFDVKTGVASCPGSSLPTTIDLQVINATAYPSVIINQQFDVDASKCKRAGEFNIPGPLGGGSPLGFNESIVCAFKMTRVVNFRYWSPILLRARSSFSAEKASKWIYNRNFYNASFSRPSKLIPIVSTKHAYPIVSTKHAYPPQAGQFNYDTQFLLNPYVPGPTQIDQDYRKMYNVPDSEPSNVQASIAQAVLEFNYTAQAPGYRRSDLSEYMTYTKNTRFNENDARYIGMNESLGPGGESQLDIQMMMGVTPGVVTYFWTFQEGDGSHFGEVMANWADSVVTDALKLNPRPQAYSISYGSPEIPEQQQYTENMKRAATKIALASSAGITTFVSSGDAGSSSVRAQFIFGPSFPASCPAVVGVGATANILDTTGQVTHMPSSSSYGNLITSGGGVSTIFPVPSFQQDIFDNQVSSLIKGLVVDGVATAAGRLSPDVSAMGTNILAIINGTKIGVAGTSASSPLFASIMTIWNNGLVKNGLPTLRNANAWVNNNPKIFSDIGQGFDNCAGSGQFANYPIFPVCWRTMEGWDFPTGHGEPVDFLNIFASIEAWQKAHKDASDKTSEIIGIIFGVFGALTLVIIVFVIIKKRQDATTDVAAALNQGNNNNNSGGVINNESQTKYGAADV